MPSCQSAHAQILSLTCARAHHVTRSISIVVLPAASFTNPLQDYQENALRIESLTPVKDPWTTLTSELFSLTLTYRPFTAGYYTLILGSAVASSAAFAQSF